MQLHYKAMLRILEAIRCRKAIVGTYRTDNRQTQTYGRLARSVGIETVEDTFAVESLVATIAHTDIFIIHEYRYRSAIRGIDKGILYEIGHEHTRHRLIHIYI